MAAKRQRTREELLDEIDDLRGEVSDLEEENDRLSSRLDSVVSVASGEDEEDEEEEENPA
jgi:hypothetical protein